MALPPSLSFRAPLALTHALPSAHPRHEFVKSRGTIPIPPGKGTYCTQPSAGRSGEHPCPGCSHFSPVLGASLGPAWPRGFPRGRGNSLWLTRSGKAEVWWWGLRYHFRQRKRTFLLSPGDAGSSQGGGKASSCLMILLVSIPVPGLELGSPLPLWHRGGLLPLEPILSWTSKQRGRCFNSSQASGVRGWFW